MTEKGSGSIGVWGGIALIVGITIGSGIFRTPGSIANWVPDPKIVLSLWVLFGLVSLCGALSVTELASMLPRSGGVYVYLREAYGDATAFVFGWLYLVVAGPAATGALATFSTELIAQFFPGSLEAGSLAFLPEGLVHDVGTPPDATATSIHVYSPPLSTMTFYEDGSGLPDHVLDVGDEAALLDARVVSQALHPSAAPPPRPTVR